MQNHHEKFLNLAVNLSEKNRGLTASNPVVGCVIVKDNQIISTGITEIWGFPHAEMVAIEKVQNKETLIGAQIYLSLEPCSHFGKTPPCVDEIIKYKFKTAIIGCIDPDSRVNGQGIAKLKEAGIEVIFIDKTKEFREINSGFFKSRIHQMPFITVKIATTLDGKIADKNFYSKWISNEESRRFSHYLRSINNAILVGANSLKNDNPELSCRFGYSTANDLIKIVIANNPNINKNLQIIQQANKSRIIIITANNSPIWQEFSNLGVKIILVRNLAEKLNIDNNNFKIDWHDALLQLNQLGINNILVEGGNITITSLLQENLVDCLYWVSSNKILGSNHINAIGNLQIASLHNAIDYFSLKEVKIIENDVVKKFINQKLIF